MNDIERWKNMSDIEVRFEAWWYEEGCELFVDGLDTDKTACRVAWMNGAYVQKHTKEQV